MTKIRIFKTKRSFLKPRISRMTRIRLKNKENIFNHETHETHEKRLTGYLI